MQIHVDMHGDTMIADPLDFGRLSVSIADGAAPPAGIRVDGAHAWIREDWLRCAPGLEQVEAWQSGLTKMIAYATTKGWVDVPTASIRAHIETGQ